MFNLKDSVNQNYLVVFDGSGDMFVYDSNSLNLLSTIKIKGEDFSSVLFMESANTMISLTNQG